jgi:biotin operon repressor
MDKETADKDGLIERCKKMKWMEVRDAGLLGPLIKATGFGHKRLAKLMGWSRSMSFRHACQAEVGKGDAHQVVFPVQIESIPSEAEVVGPPSGLANDIYLYLKANPRGRYSEAQLSEKFDKSEKSVSIALGQLRSAGYQIGNTAEGETRSVRLEREVPSLSGQRVLTNWGDTKLRFGYVSDSHLGNLCACTDELQAMYDLYVKEGITEVLHSGDLTDGPGNRGFRGHANEVRDDCQTAFQLARYAIANYPQREGITTHFIESSKSHDGWELAYSGFSVGSSIVKGFDYTVLGPEGKRDVHQDGRSDLVFLGYDDVALGMGPEGKTTITLLHPDGGTAYSISYHPQKWAESLEGGTKPDIGLLGHYHKLNWIRVRNIQVLTGECMCWQTPFMRRKRLAAHVGAFILEMRVEADGTVREFVPREFPFYFGEKRVFYIG